jgi:methyl-accepting chemotaxis protein
VTINFINNISTKIKLVSLTFILISGIFLYSIWHMNLQYNEYNEMNNLKSIVILSTKISALVHETQKERGATAGYLGSKGENFSEILKKQRLSTNLKLNDLKLYLKDFNKDNYSKKFNSLLNDAISNIEQLNYIRKEVDLFKINGKEAIGFYTNKINTIFLDTIASATNMSTNYEVVNHLNSYVNFLYAKERSGIERAVLSNTFGANKFNKGMYRKFIQLVTEQGSFIKSFNVTASKSWQLNFNSTLQGFAVNETQRLRDIAFSKASIGGFNIDAEYWFKTITKKINLLKKIEDYQSKTLIEDVNLKLNKAWKILMVLIFLFLIPAFLTVLYTFFVITHITKSLKNIENGLISFFAFLHRQREDVIDLDIKSKDEFGIIAKLINENINSTKLIIKNDNSVVDEIIDLVEKAEAGFYSYRSKIQASSPELEKLRINFNRMLNTTNTNLSYIKESLLSYGSNDFSHKIKSDGIGGNIGVLISSTQVLGNNISELLSILDNESIYLKNNINTLSQSTNILSTSSNHQAVSLEQTTANIKSMIDNIRSNNDKSNQIYKISEENALSVESGHNLALETANAMDNIESIALEIAEAITAINQIAFQTNIISLNAAVEAATAGEAGKGFAVVAGEVRNLATKSAETAKQITEVVEKAIVKTSEGKRISNLMIDDYNKLEEKMQVTTLLTAEISSDSKKQMSSVEQIETTMIELDKVTQENAKVANDITDMTNSISLMSNKLSQIVSNTKYLEDSKTQVCEVDLSFEIANLKLDHIKFKDENLTDLNEQKSINIANTNDCTMGKWIELNKNKKISTTYSWDKLLEAHKNVHESVKQYLINNQKNPTNNILIKNSNDIENYTFKFFKFFNQVKAEYCEIVKLEKTKDSSSNRDTTFKKNSIDNLTNTKNEWDSF